MLGDSVVFCKGKNSILRNKKWDRIYISTLFTFYWNTTIATIKYYKKCVENPCDIYVGGSMATVMANEIVAEKGLEDITIIEGLLDKPGILDKNDLIIDEMTPDYSIVNQLTNENLSYSYPISDTYIIHATRGCIRECDYCAVPQIEPKFKSYIDIKPKINDIIKKYGEKRNLMIMDNNIVASPHLNKIVDDIIECGFGVDNNAYTYIINGRTRTKKRYVDFNQGLDARILYEKPEKMLLLGKLAVKPLRVAFDHADDEFIEIYKKCMYMAAESRIKEVSNYILFNYDDKPNDLYKRLEINVLLNSEFEDKDCITRIWSFPMRFSPIFGEESRGRKHVGRQWKRKQLRAIQCILNATHGVVGPKKTYFYRAFGENIEAFNKLLWMPEKYIIFRKENEDNGNSAEWSKLHSQLTPQTQKEFCELIGCNVFKELESDTKIIQELLKHYVN
jgi:hypothetical protein